MYRDPKCDGGPCGCSVEFLHVRDRLMNAPITLDGRKAYLAGRCTQFPVVWDAEDMARQVPFAWPTVKRIIEEKGGAFKS